MSNLFQRLKEQSDGMEQYQANAKLVIQTQDHNVDVEAEQTVAIPFHIDMDASGYGIKNINILATSTINVAWEEVGVENEQRVPRNAKIDLSTAEVEWVAGGFYGISELILSVTTGGGVANARLVCVYIEKGN